MSAVARPSFLVGYGLTLRSMEKAAALEKENRLGEAAATYLQAHEQRKQLRAIAEVEKQFAALNAIDGVEAVAPEGAFYAWVRIQKKDMDSFALCNYLLEEALVVGVPGEAYGKGGQECIRFSFATALDGLLEAADRMKLALDRL